MGLTNRYFTELSRRMFRDLLFRHPDILDLDGVIVSLFSSVGTNKGVLKKHMIFGYIDHSFGIGYRIRPEFLQKLIKA